jgi:hypothetical protein
MTMVESSAAAAAAAGTLETDAETNCSLFASLVQVNTAAAWVPSRTIPTAPSRIFAAEEKHQRGPTPATSSLQSRAVTSFRRSYPDRKSPTLAASASASATQMLTKTSSAKKRDAEGDEERTNYRP